MQYLKTMAMILGLSATMFAADPFAGTWKMNTAKSKYKTGTAPKEQTLAITEAGSDINVKVTGTTSDGKPIVMTYTIPSGGGTGKIVESSVYDGVSAKSKAAGEREMTYSKGGKALYTAHSMVAKDGHSLTVHGKGVNSAGQTVDATAVYDKQK